MALLGGVLGSIGDAVATAGSALGGAGTTADAISGLSEAGNAASAASATGAVPGGSGIIGTIGDMVGIAPETSKGISSIVNGATGGDPLSAIGALLSKSKKSGLGAGQPQSYMEALNQAQHSQKGLVDQVMNWQDENNPMTSQGIIGQIMGGGYGR